jgi:hypothetical protein
MARLVGGQLPNPNLPYGDEAGKLAVLFSSALCLTVRSSGGVHFGSDSDE